VTEAAVDGWRADTVRGGLRLVLLRGLFVACLLLPLVGLSLLDGAHPRELAAGSAALTLGAGVAAAGLAELEVRRRGWTVQRGCDLIVAVSTLCAACAFVQFTYATGALVGGPPAGYAVLTAKLAPERLPPLLLGSVVYWGLPCGLMTFESAELRDLWRRHPALVLAALFTCMGVGFGLLVLTAAYHLAARVDERLGARDRRD
jgi:hypothetical protein